jgi:PAS domain S-box-containing protein
LNLAPQIAGALVADVIIGAVLAFFYMRQHGQHLRLWAMAFGVSAVRQAFALTAVIDQSRAIYEFAIRAGVVLAGLLLMRGTYEFLGRAVPRLWYAGAAVVFLWIVGSPLLGVSFLVATTPVFLFRASTDLVTGVTVLRRTRGVGRLIAGVGFVLWGLHRANYPVLRPLEWAAPWGFELASLLAIVIAIGVITMHYEHVREELSLSEAKYRSMFEDALDGQIQTDPQGRIYAANPALVAMLGYDSEEDLRGTNMAELYATPDERDRLIAAHEADGILKGAELRWKRKDGRVIDVKLRGRRVHDSDGVAYFKGSVHDITSQKMMREQLDLARRMEAVGRLAGGIAHDFNNVLTAIVTGVELVADEIASGDDPDEDLEAIHRSALQGAELSRRLLAFSRPEIADQNPVGFDDTLNSAAMILRRLIPENIQLELSPGAGSAHVMVDPGQLERVIINLAINAQQAVSEGGTIWIETSRSPDGRSVTLSVRDDGAGMDEETAARIFEPFFTTRTMGRGTGLGLATVFNIVNSLDGTIEVDSTPGEGTEFRIVLPTCEVQPEEDAAMEPVLSVAGAPPVVLLVEDEAMVRRIVTRTLENAGFETIVASDGETALRVARENLARISIVVTDVVMPKLSGPELVEALLKERPDLPYLLLSGYTADKMEESGIGMDHFLEKPFSKARLLEKIDQLRTDEAPEAAAD